MKNKYLQRFMGIYILIIIVIFLTWAAFFEVDQIIKAQGQIIHQIKTQIIQSADGGVITELKVVEGDFVKKNQLLAKLESERANAGVNEILNRIASLQINQIRAQAEATNQIPNFSNFIKKHNDLVISQQDLYLQNQSAFIKEYTALNEQLQFTLSELELMRKLFDNGYVSYMEFVRSQKSVVETRQKLESSQEKYKSDARRELAKIEEEMTSQISKLQEKQSLLDHTLIQSPVDGVVKSLRFNTIGGVLKGGDELMQISPTVGSYVVEAKINPVDIGQIKLGMPVTLRLDAFDYSIYGSLAGKLTYISPDTLTEQSPDGRSQVYYRAKIELDDNAKNKHIKLSDLKPGMTISLDVNIGKRSVLTFIVKPIFRGFSGALGQK